MPELPVTASVSVTGETITRNTIEALIDAELAQARASFPRWVHPFQGWDLSRARRVLGQAHSDGRVKITSLFLGTRAHEDLRDTIRHEFAHLIAGLRARHGPKWKAVAAQLGATPLATGRMASRELRERMEDAPWSLMALLQNGEEILLKPAYRRSAQFLDYEAGTGPMTSRREYYYRGQRVQRFRYVSRELSRE